MEGFYPTAICSIEELKASKNIKGDVNDDERVTIEDVARLVSFLNGNASALSNKSNADVDGQNGITIEDVYALKNIVKKIK